MAKNKAKRVGISKNRLCPDLTKVSHILGIKREDFLKNVKSSDFKTVSVFVKKHKTLSSTPTNKPSHSPTL